MNKNGWGLRMELVIILIFVVCLIIATIGLTNFGLLGGNSTEYYGDTEYDNFSYTSLENEISASALKYYKNRYPSGLNDAIVINSSTLINTGYMHTLHDADNKECRGYAVINKNGAIIGYVRCKKYRTDGYNKDYER